MISMDSVSKLKRLVKGGLIRFSNCFIMLPFLVGALVAVPASAQLNGAAALPAQLAAPVDLSGYWVAVVTEDWIERMAPDSPPSGTIGGGVLGRGINGDAELADENAGNTNPDDICRVYGAAGSLRIPGRIHITWKDTDTLEIETDAGSQHRIFNFDPSVSVPGQKSLQGHSSASWEFPIPTGGRFVPADPDAPLEWAGLKVVTTNMTGGYLLTSRSSYSEDAVLTEHFTYHTDFGVEYLTVMALVEDRGASIATSSTFKKESNGSKFSPTDCEIVR
jgi:hypothetical protein